MSKAIYIKVREEKHHLKYKSRLEKILPSLIPDNIPNCKYEIKEDGTLFFGVINPAENNMCSQNSLCLGQILGNCDGWDIPLSLYPDGAFCLFRSNGNILEIVSDVVGSRTMWYYFDMEVFIASNSQRAIISLINSYSLNKAVIPWMLSTGTMGPFLSWDERISMLEINSNLILDVSKWDYTINKNPVLFKVDQISEEKQEELLEKELLKAFEGLNLNLSKWVLPLSGGVDSRAILFYLKKFNPTFSKLKSLTWGKPGAENRKGNDAYIAQKLADYLKIEHEFAPLSVTSENVNTIFSRFLNAGEGRVDAISGYTDGFEIWKKLFENNVTGVIRGEQTFGGPEVDNERDARAAVGISFCEDYANLSNQDFNFKLQQLPEHLQRKTDESILTWRDRLIIEYRAPILKAALNDLKLAYVEISTPLISKGITERITKMNDEQRLKKSLFKSVIKKISIPIELATEVAIETPNEIFNNPEILELFNSQLNKPFNEKVFPAGFYSYIKKSLGDVVMSLQGKPKKASLISKIKKLIPKKYKKKLNKLKLTHQIPVTRLAFRAFIISRMIETFQTDIKKN